MTAAILLVIGIVVVALLLFLTERLRVDLIALLVLLALSLCGLVTPNQAVAGFSSPVVITVCSIFVLSAGLYQAGVAGWLGRQILRFGGKGEIRLLLGIMLLAAGMSFFMNTIGIVALMLPAVMDIARRTGRAPSKLLMPLSFGALLGGYTTLFATLTNLLVSESLRAAGLRPFGLFDFAPVGLVAATSGILFLAFFGRRLLPDRNLSKEASLQHGMRFMETLDFKERTFVMRVPAGSALAGETLQDTRLGSALGLQVVGVIRDGDTHVAPGPRFELRDDDRLIVQGTTAQLDALADWRTLKLQPNSEWGNLVADGIGFAEVTLGAQSSLSGHTLAWVGFRHQFGVMVLAIRRGSLVYHDGLQQRRLQADDVLLVCGPTEKLEALTSGEALESFHPLTQAELHELYHLEDRHFTLTITEESHLANITLGKSRLGDALGFAVLAIMRGEQTIVLPGREEVLQAGDGLMILGQASDLERLNAIGGLVREREISRSWAEIETEQFGLVEAVLSPHCSLVGKTLMEIQFRGQFGLNVMGLWRQGTAHTANLRDLRLAHGDVLLLHGPKEKLRALSTNADFILLTQAIQPAPQYSKAPWAVLAMLMFLVPAMIGWLPVHLAALLGAVVMVLTRCISMEEACQSVDLKSILLIAGMLPLGTALRESGAARWFAEGLVTLSRPFGDMAILGTIFLIVTVGTTIMPAAAFVVLMAPIALHTAATLGLSPHAVMMTVAVAAAGSFNSPIAHPANVMIMGPGGYRFSDYAKVGIPLTILVMIVTLLVLPWFWPLHG
ncbi:SLC13 family permease [Prosthecobacter sp.]|uniref:SLC13 family permease n=1 Tax=Prosthecobacter sp. TaxID=1965333 RepID=UPI001DF20A39|nr:SLC13 family permease [Prosthecobacter sp.]MCB1275741.1 SLC13 family permease [Prosthecobacter sp.]